VAICGRTGSGKSSIVLLLLRLLDPLSSCRDHTTIDDIPLYKIDRTVLRDRFITIPQEPSFLPDGTSIQSNLDPYGLSDEQQCKTALEAVGLWESVQRQGGLGAALFASSLSQGQKQLFSLARAVLRRRVRTADQLLVKGASTEGKCSGGVLLVDEVSSTVDGDTELAMQAVIQREFEGYTVVMDKGTIIETGHPEELVRRDGGSLQRL
jgi:ABC-type multidrug transport system fused ATPase/permease subunit